VPCGSITLVNKIRCRYRPTVEKTDPEAIDHRRDAWIDRVVRLADLRRRDRRVRVDDGGDLIVERVGVGRDLPLRIGDRLQPAGDRLKSRRPCSRRVRAPAGRSSRTMRYLTELLRQAHNPTSYEVSIESCLAAIVFPRRRW